MLKIPVINLKSGHHPLWPALIVVAGYLVADFFLEGITAALFVGSLGILEFLIILLITRRAMPSLIVEGFALGAIGYAGFLIAVPGAGITILELSAGAVFLVSCLLGKPFLGGQIRKITGSGIRLSMARDMTFVFGLVFLVHGILMLLMILMGGIRCSGGVRGALHRFGDLVQEKGQERRGPETSLSRVLRLRGVDSIDR